MGCGTPFWPSGIPVSSPRLFNPGARFRRYAKALPTIFCSGSGVFIGTLRLFGACSRIWMNTHSAAIIVNWEMNEALLNG
jgi:hypothetical protein